MKVAVIGGGAAGFFSAICIKDNYPKAEVAIFEKSTKLLSKVKISGGGRCNVTNGCTSIPTLSKAYPRGGKKLKKAFREFSTQDTMTWFESRGVPLMTQVDGCVFPVSQDSQSIIDCFMQQVKKHSIQIHTKTPVATIENKDEKVQLTFGKDSRPTELFDKVIVATGGSPKLSGLQWLEDAGHKIIPPVPSLFTFNMPSENVTNLMGIVVEETQTEIQGTKHISDGPLLITHWGMSGPSILKLSAFAARDLHDMDYTFKVRVNWINEKNNGVVLSVLEEYKREHPKKLLSNLKPSVIPMRLWIYLLEKKDISPEKKWEDAGKKAMNKLVTVLTNDVYNVKGKTTFKEEFVTCGGVSLESIDFKTMQSRVCNNVYFAGEVLDIDAITGGYNFQGAWTTAFIAARLES